MRCDARWRDMIERNNPRDPVPSKIVQYDPGPWHFCVLDAGHPERCEDVDGKKAPR